MAGRLVDVDVDADHEVERLERALEPRRCSGVETTGLPAIVTSARTRPSPGVSISSASAATGSSPNDLGRPLTRLCQRPSRTPLPLARRAGRVALPGGGEREHRAALAVEVAGEHVEDVDEPARQRAELLRAWCRSARTRRRRSAAASSRAIRRISSASIPHGRRDRLGREGRARSSSASSSAVQRARRARPGSTSPSAISASTIANSSRRVGAGPDEVVLVGLVGGAAAARVDHHDLAAALADARAAARACRARSAGCRWRRAGWRRASAGGRVRSTSGTGTRQRRRRTSARRRPASASGRPCDAE